MHYVVKGAVQNWTLCEWWLAFSCRLNAGGRPCWSTLVSSTAGKGAEMAQAPVTTASRHSLGTIYHTWCLVILQTCEVCIPHDIGMNLCYNCQPLSLSIFQIPKPKQVLQLHNAVLVAMCSFLSMASWGASFTLRTKKISAKGKDTKEFVQHAAGPSFSADIMVSYETYMSLWCLLSLPYNICSLASNLHDVCCLCNI